MNQATIKRYIWLIDTVYKAEKEGITYDEIAKSWMDSDLSGGHNYPLRSFHNHRKEIQNVFNINIKCRKKNNCYYIENKDDNDGNVTKLLELISINQMHNQHPELSKHLITEAHIGGECYLSVLMNAITEQRLLKLEYKPYWSERTQRYQFFAPYAIKEFKGGWYLLGQRSTDKIELIDLKTVTSVKTLTDTFTMPSDDVVARLLNDHFGTVIENIETEEIMIKVGARYAAELRNFPLHSSQREIEKKRGHSVFYFYLKPNSDFRHEILSFGADMEVIAPQHLRSEISQEAKKLSKKNS